jgi:hypothetical protein
MIKETSVQPPFEVNQSLEQPPVPGLGSFVRLSGDAEQVSDSLGPLANLVGTWVGNHGWNMIAVPQGKSFLLLVRPFIETITFYPLGAPVPDRAPEGDELFITGLGYDLRVTDAGTNQPMHIENGMWLLLNQDINKTPQKYSIARHSIIPHGDSLLALGNFTVTDGPPQISDVDGRPTDIGSKPLFDYLQQYTDKTTKEFDPGNVTATLRATIQAQNISQTTRFELDTANNGGILNIPFIVKNANASDFKCKFWLETVETGDPQFPEFLQLQYFQQTNLNFVPKFNVPRNPDDLIMWPHTNVNTLVKQ